MITPFFLYNILVYIPNGEPQLLNPTRLDLKLRELRGLTTTPQGLYIIIS
jgi:hypothetical protein